MTTETLESAFVPSLWQDDPAVPIARHRGIGLALMATMVPGLISVLVSLAVWRHRVESAFAVGGIATPFREELAVVLAGSLLSLFTFFGALVALRTREDARTQARERSRSLACRESEMRSVIDQMGDALLAFDAEGSIRFANLAAEALFARDPWTFTGERIEAFVPGALALPDDGGYRRATGRRLAQLFPVEISVSDMDMAGPGWRVAIVRDISERVRADRDLQDREARLRALVDNMPDGLVVADGQGIIESANRAAEQLLGYTPEDLVGRFAGDLLPMREVARAESWAASRPDRSLGATGEWDLRRRDGTEVRVEVSLSTFDGPTGQRYAAFLRDVSERERIDRLKREFVATVSHELRTPLTSIRGSLGLLAAGVLGDLPDEARDIVAIAERNTERLVRLINDILDLERIEDGRFELILGIVSLRDVAERAFEAVGSLATARGVRLECGEVRGVLWADGDRLIQVLVNLLSNAVKFSPPGGKVWLGRTRSDGAVTMSVRDEGRGISDEFRERIFGRFQQAEGSDSQQKGGAGLGLAISRAIVERHGGTIGFDSVPGEGTTFWFKLPSLVPDDSGGRVVLYGCDGERAQGIRRCIELEGHELHEPNQPDDLRRILAEAPPLLIVTALRAPATWGDALLEAVEVVPGIADVPMVVLGSGDLGMPDRLVDAVHGGFSEAETNDVLLVEADAAMLGVLARQLLSDGIAVRAVASARQAARAVLERAPGLLVLDPALPDADGIALIEFLRRHPCAASLPTLVYSAGEIELAERDQLQLGPTRFLTKSRTTDSEFRQVVESMLAQRRAS